MFVFQISSFSAVIPLERAKKAAEALIPQKKSAQSSPATEQNGQTLEKRTYTINAVASEASAPSELLRLPAGLS